MFLNVGQVMGRITDFINSATHPAEAILFLQSNGARIANQHFVSHNAAVQDGVIVEAGPGLHCLLQNIYISDRLAAIAKLEIELESEILEIFRREGIDIFI